MTGFKCRGLRLLGFATLGAAFALPTMAASLPATQTRISAETRDTAGLTKATISIAVAPDKGNAATGTVVLQDGKTPLAGAALNADGAATITVDLVPGTHELTAVYGGDATHAGSVSDVQVISAAAPSTPDFAVSVNPGSASVTAGASGTATVSISPINSSSLTAPMFVTISCSGLPDQSSCSFTPENVEILPNATGATTSTMVIATQGPNTHSAIRQNSSVSWAVLLPGTLGLAGLVFSARRRWLQRVSLMVLVGSVAIVGMSACNPRYNYYHHGPNQNLPTPAGTYTLQVAAQSSNGVTAITHTTQFPLTVK